MTHALVAIAIWLIRFVESLATSHGEISFDVGRLPHSMQPTNSESGVTESNVDIGTCCSPQVFAAWQHCKAAPKEVSDDQPLWEVLLVAFNHEGAQTCEKAKYSLRAATSRLASGILVSRLADFHDGLVCKCRPLLADWHSFRLWHLRTFTF